MSNAASSPPATPLRQRSVLQLPGTDRPTGFALPSFVPITEALWVADKERSRCRTCNRSFNLLRRKHHCRGCAEIFCEDCSNFKLCTKLVHEVLHVRVCGACFQQHGATEEEPLERTEAVAVAQQAEVAPEPASPAPATSRSRAGSASVSHTRSPPPAAAPMEPIAEHVAPATVSVPSTAAAVSTRSSFLLGAVAGASLLVITLCMVEALPWHTMLIVPLMGGGVFLVKGAEARSALATHTAAVPSSTLSSTSPARRVRAISNAVQHESPAHPSLSRPRASSHLLEPHSASLPLSPTPRRASLSSSASFPGGLRLSFDAELASLRLSPEDEQLVRWGRENLEIIERYASEHEGWRTKRITRPDGSGSVNIPNPHAQVDFDTLALTTSNTILVQCRNVPTRDGGGKRNNSKNSHLAWKSVGLVQFSPEYLFRLLFDQDNQCSWNKSLLQSRILRTIHGSRASVAYVVSAPAVGGAVSSRDFVNVHEWNRTEWVDAEGRTHTDYTFAGGGLTQDQYAVPLNPAFVRGMSGPSGYVMRSIMPPAGHAAAADPAARWTQFVLLLDTDVKGWIPKSLTDGAMPDVAVEWITNFRQALAKRVELGLPMAPMATDVYS